MISFDFQKFDMISSASSPAQLRDSQAETTLNDLPDDIMELIVRLIVILFSDVNEDGYGAGGMNVSRLVSKRFMRVVESCATRLSQRDYDGPDSLPLALRRCVRIQHIRCYSTNLRSLEGCPDGLKNLYIGDGHSLESLEPLRRCVQLESLTANAERIIDLSPLSSCPRLKKLTLRNSRVTDISALSSMPLLEDLSIMGCMNVKSLEPLSGLMNLQRLYCRGIDPIASLLPLASCTGLKELTCSGGALGLKDLQSKLPHIRILL